MSRWLGSIVVCGAVLALASCGQPQPAADPDAGFTEGVQPRAEPQPDQFGTGQDAALPPADVDVTLTEWRVALSRAEVPAGLTALLVSNGGTVPHALVLEGAGERWETDVLNPGESVRMTVDLRGGAYNVFCPRTGDGGAHVELGMMTQLRVR
jgi:hypothetical protein